MRHLRTTVLAATGAALLGGASPAGIGEVTVRDPHGEVTVQLRRERCWRHRGIASSEDPWAHQHPLSTAFRPQLTRRRGSTSCLWTGYRPSAHERPGDTVVSYRLLLERAGNDGAVAALWHEDHMEVPTVLFTAQGRLQGPILELALEGGEMADDAVLEGVLIEGR
jgi:hypothetical protein